MTCECWDFDGTNNRGDAIYRCNGTRERELCFCKGDKSKCDFYENVKKEGELEKKQKEIVKIDNKPFNMMEGLYKIIDRCLNNASVRSIEVEVKDFIQIKINRQKGE